MNKLALVAVLFAAIFVTLALVARRKAGANTADRGSDGDSGAGSWDSSDGGGDGGGGD